MALWPRRAQASLAHVQAEAFPWEPNNNVVQITTGMPVQVAGVWDAPVSRDLALSLPAVLRASTILTTTFAALPLERVDAAGARLPLGWLEQPESNRPRFNTLTDTAKDLLFDGIAYWRVNKREANGEPSRGGCEYIDLTRVGDIVLTDGRRSITIDGRPEDPKNVIAFEGWHDGIRRHGARTIRIAIALEAAARRYADNPNPTVNMRNVSGIPMTDDEITALVLGWKTGRNTEGVGFTNDLVEVDAIGFDPKALQLVEARQYMASLLCDLVGVTESVVASAATATSAIEYVNVSIAGRALTDYGLKNYINTVEARLSLSDVQGNAWANQVTPRGTSVHFVVDGLLRGAPKEQAEIVEILIRSGVITPDQAGDYIDLVPRGTTA